MITIFRSSKALKNDCDINFKINNQSSQFHLSNNQALVDKIGELVAKDVTHNTQVTTNNSGLIKYSCGYKELKYFTFDFEAGVDKQTMRLSIATTIAHWFTYFIQLKHVAQVLLE